MYVCVCMCLVYDPVCSPSCSDILVRVNVDTLLSFTVKLIIFKWPVRAEIVLSGIFY